MLPTSMTLRITHCLALALLLAMPASGAAQSTGPTPWGLFSVRYDTRTSDFIYAAYGYGKTFAMVGVLENPRSGYTEQLGAVGRTFSLGDRYSHVMATGVAKASDGWYAQLYYLPTIHAGPAWVRATAEWYFPVDRSGTLQFALSPLSATVPVARRVEVGAAMDLAAQRGDRTGGGIGPEVRIILPKAVLGVDAQRMVNTDASRLRVFFLTNF